MHAGSDAPTSCLLLVLVRFCWLLGVAVMSRIFYFFFVSSDTRIATWCTNKFVRIYNNNRNAAAHMYY